MSFPRISLVAMVVCLLLGAPESAQCQFEVGHIPVIQADTPVQVTAVGMNKEKTHVGFFVVKNESSARLEGVQLGWTLHVCGHSETDILTCHENEPLLKGVSGSIAIVLHPGEEARLDAGVVDVKKLKAKIEARGVDSDQLFLVLFGIALARFGDGTEWDYDIVNESGWKWKEGILDGQASVLSGLGCGECSFACFNGAFCRSAHHAFLCCCDAGGCYTRPCGQNCGFPGGFAAVWPSEKGRIQNQSCKNREKPVVHLSAIVPQ
ncbi:MAG: hypothetical protein ACRD5I_10130 [Candidatus Acidiferrales bacterium]